MSQTAVDVSVRILTQCERIARPHHLSLLCPISNCGISDSLILHKARICIKSAALD